MVQLDRKLNPDVLAWAIAESGYTHSEIAKHLKIEDSVVGRWMRGEAQPSQGQFTNLAKTIKRPKFVFFLDEVPEELSLSGYHRMSGPSGESVPLNPQERLVVRHAHYMQVFLSELVSTSERPRIEFPDLSGESSVSAGIELRNWVDTFGNGAKTRSPSLNKDFRTWRKTIHLAGIFVMLFRVPEHAGSPSKLRGFSIPDDFAPVICVVSKDIAPARSFTLFHELAHLTRRFNVACHVPTPNTTSVERWCDRVANRALIDRERLTALVGEGIADFETVQRVAGQFKVSMRAAALAIQDSSPRNDGLYARIHAALPWRDIPEKSKPGGGQPRHKLRVSQFGELAVSTVLGALADRRIGEAQIRRFLKIDGPDIEAAAADVGIKLPW